MTKRTYMSPPTMPLAERLALRVVVDEVSGCHNWIGPVTRGYGKLWNPAVGQNQQTHRIAYELANGAIPDGFQVDHLCKNRLCCNPAHLEAVTQQENIRRSDAPSARHARKTHCSHGHPFEGANLRIYAGKRYCVTCQDRKTRERAAKRQAVQGAGQSNGTNPNPSDQP